MENVSQLVEEVREHYLDQFLGFVRLMRERWETGGPEVKFEVPEPDDLYRKLYCIDFVANEDDELIVRELQPDKILAFDGFTHELRGMDVTFDCLVWDDLELHHDASALHAEAVAPWFEHWFDPDDVRWKPDAEIGDIIHSMTFRPGYIHADLGTATADAFWDLMDVIAKAGATRVRISSSREVGQS